MPGVEVSTKMFGIYMINKIFINGKKNNAKDIDFIDRKKLTYKYVSKVTKTFQNDALPQKVNIT